MRTETFLTRRILPVLAAALVLTLSACGAKKPEPTPTLSVKALYTAAAETISAQQATQKALTPPTATPTDTPFPTLAPPPTVGPISLFGTATTSAGGGGGAAGCDGSAYIADVTIPDGTAMLPGKKFTKTWTLMNNGSCAWSASYKLAFLAGDQMGGADAPVPQAVPSGQQINLSVELTAPEAAGSYTGQWQMENASSQRFGNIITVVIKVGAAATNTPGAATNTPGTPAASATPTTP